MADSEQWGPQEKREQQYCGGTEVRTHNLHVVKWEYRQVKAERTLVPANLVVIAVK